MANRALANKLRRANRERQEAGFQAYAKLAYWNNDALDGQYREMRALIAAVHPSHITKCEPGKASGLQYDVGTCGKGRSYASKKTYGDGTRFHNHEERYLNSFVGNLTDNWELIKKA